QRDKNARLGGHQVGRKHRCRSAARPGRIAQRLGCRSCRHPLTPAMERLRLKTLSCQEVLVSVLPNASRPEPQIVLFDEVEEVTTPVGLHTGFVFATRAEVALELVPCKLNELHREPGFFHVVQQWLIATDGVFTCCSTVLDKGLQLNAWLAFTHFGGTEAAHCIEVCMAVRLSGLGKRCHPIAFHLGQLEDGFFPDAQAVKFNPDNSRAGHQDVYTALTPITSVFNLVFGSQLPALFPE